MLCTTSILGNVENRLIFFNKVELNFSWVTKVEGIWVWTDNLDTIWAELKPGREILGERKEEHLLAKEGILIFWNICLEINLNTIYNLRWVDLESKGTRRNDKLDKYSYTHQLCRIHTSLLAEPQEWVNWINLFQLLIDLISDLLILAAQPVNLWRQI